MILHIGSASCKGPIIIEDDVWIGESVIVMSGVHIGRGAVIGAGAVVTKNIPSYSVVVGAPATVIKYRFDRDVIAKLQRIDFEKISAEEIVSNIALFSEKLNDDILNKIMNKYGRGKDRKSLFYNVRKGDRSGKDR